MLGLCQVVLTTVTKTLLKTWRKLCQPIISYHEFNFKLLSLKIQRNVSSLIRRMSKLQERHARLKSYLSYVESTLSLIHSRDLINRQYTPSKRHVYHRLVANLEADLKTLRKALEQDGTWWMRIKRWWGGFDLENVVLELKWRSFKVWEGLNSGPL